MKKIWSMVVVLVVGLALPSMTWAQAPTAPEESTRGSFGLGWDNNVGGVTARYFLSDSFGLDLTLGFGFEPADDDVHGAEAEAKVDFNGQLAAVYAIQLHPRAYLNLEGGFLFVNAGSHTADRSSQNFAIFVGLAPELMVFEQLAFSFFFGFAANFTETPAPTATDPNKTTYVMNFGTTGAAADLVRGFRFHWYF